MVTLAVDSARRNDKALEKRYDLARTKIRVVHDTIEVVGDDDPVAVSPEIAAVILAADSTIAAQKRSLALQDTLIASLRNGIALRDTRIKILEREVTPGKFKRLVTATKWVAIGAIAGAAFVHR